MGEPHELQLICQAKLSCFVDTIKEWHDFKVYFLLLHKR